MDVDAGAVDAAFRDARRRADDPRPHAPAGARTSSTSTAALRAASCSPTGTTAALPRGGRGGVARIGVARCGRPATEARTLAEASESAEADARSPPATPSACAKSAIRSSSSSMPTETRISDSAMPISARRSGPISQKIVCATGIASVRLSPRFDDEHDDLSSRLRKSKQSMPSASSNDEQRAVAAEQRSRASACCGCDGEARVVDGAHARMRGEEVARAPARSRTAAPCAARASRRRPRCDAPARPRACRRSRAVPSCGSA